MHIRSSIRSRALVAVSAAALAATTLLAGVGSANAAIVAGAARNPDRTPVLYKDTNGIALQLCTDAVNCEPVDPAAGEIGSYFSADVQVGPIRAIWGVDAAFLENAAGQLTTRPGVTNSALFRATGLRPNARYTIQGPWGTHSCTADAQGDLNNKNCIFEGGGEAGGTVGRGPVKTFLVPSRAPRGFLGNLAVAQTVTGSPTGFNKVHVSGPGLNATSNRFVLGGQLAANQPMGMVSTTAMKLGSRSNVKKVTKTITYRSVGTAPARVQVRRAGANPVAFKVSRNCGAVDPHTSCKISVTYKPGAHDKKAALVINDNTLAPPHRVSLTGITGR
jgi:hypothetical protein